MQKTKQKIVLVCVVPVRIVEQLLDSIAHQSYGSYERYCAKNVKPNQHGVPQPLRSTFGLTIICFTVSWRTEKAAPPGSQLERCSEACNKVLLERTFPAESCRMPRSVALIGSREPYESILRILGLWMIIMLKLLINGSMSFVFRKVK